jgi:hypothetical protein
MTLHTPLFANRFGGYNALFAALKYGAEKQFTQKCQTMLFNQAQQRTMQWQAPAQHFRAKALATRALGC